MKEEYETWLRTQCFQEPTKEAKTLAWEAFQAGTKLQDDWFQLGVYYRFPISKVRDILRGAGISKFSITIRFEDRTEMNIAYKSEASRDSDWRILVANTPQLTNGG